MRKARATPQAGDDARRSSVRRTASMFALMALAIYLGFILFGVLGR